LYDIFWIIHYIRTGAWMSPFESSRCSHLGFTTHSEFRIEMWPNLKIANQTVMKFLSMWS
jgi:hypothetical protein